MLLTSTPEKEARFAALKKKYNSYHPYIDVNQTDPFITRRHGSFLAFHGSPMENWHSILRNGLRNMSMFSGLVTANSH